MTDSSADDMADRKFVCTICMERYINPRYLPGCGDTFCEQCLLSVVRTPPTQGSEFKCPTCKRIYDGPNGASNETILDWVEQLPLNTAIIKMMKRLELDPASPCTRENYSKSVSGGDLGERDTTVGGKPDTTISERATRIRKPSVTNSGTVKEVGGHDVSQSSTAKGEGSPDTMDKRFLCNICVDYYDKPRYLPTCGHAFCEQCLVNYVSNIQQQGTEFKCPVCRKPHSVPIGDKTPLDAIQRFPIHTVFVKMMKSLNLASSNKQTKEKEPRLCDPCTERGEKVPGVKFCTDCREVLCKTCTNCHETFKVSRNHKLIAVDIVQGDGDQPDVFGDIPKCSKHPEREVEMFCKNHNDFICAFCGIKEHKPCDIDEIPDNDSDDSDLKHEIKQLNGQVKAILKHINLLQKLRSECKFSLETNLKVVKERVQEMREVIGPRMDGVVSHVKHSAKQTAIDRGDTLDTDMYRTANIKKEAAKKAAVLDTVEKHESTKCMFISVHQLKNQIEVISKQISEEDKRFRKLDVKFEIAQNIEDFLENTDAEKLVNLRVEEKESHHKHFQDDTVVTGTKSILSRKKEREVYTNPLMHSKLEKVEEHTACHNPSCSPFYIGISPHSDGRILLSDYCEGLYCRCLCVYKPADKTLTKLYLSSYPSSATQIDANHLAVSIPEDNTISIVTIGNKLTILKSLKTQYTPRSIVALKSGHFAVAWAKPPAFGVIAIQEEEIVQKFYICRDSTGRKFKSFWSLAIDSNMEHVIQPCYYDQAVYCFDYTGQPVFTYTHPALQQPQGVAVDKCSNIYVCSSVISGSIHKLTPTGELISIITEGIPPCQRAICSDCSGTGFWVTSKSSGDLLTYYKLLMTSAV